MLYTLSIGSAIVWVFLGALLMLPQRRRTMDTLLGALLGGLLIGRLTHVILLSQTFSIRSPLLADWQTGGFHWYGALIGALLGGWLVGRLRGVALTSILPVLTVALPFLGIHAWAGCIAALCSYGAEVPTLATRLPILVWEAADIYGIVAPRYATQTLGMIGMAAVLLVALASPRRFGRVLLLTSAVMLAVDGLRGDSVPLLLGIRADQWLDIAGLLTGARLVWCNHL